MSQRRPRRVVVALVAVSMITATAFIVARATSARATPVATGADVRLLFSRDVDSLDQTLAALRGVLDAGVRDANDVGRIRARFRATRMRYKHLEAALEFYSPALAAALNSRRQEIDDDDQPPPSTLAPSGFPALEKELWPAVTTASAARARTIVDGMRATIVRMRWLVRAMAPTDPQLIEVSRLELVRLSTLGIAGFDAPVTGAALIETADALDALRATYATAGPARWPTLRTQRRLLDSTLAAASEYLRAHSDFESSDRLTIIADYLLPASRALNALRNAANTPPLTMPRPLRALAASPYERNAFDVRAYTPSGAPTPTPEVIALGERLFADPALSRWATRSCASCHAPTHAFVDGLVTATSIDRGGARVIRNTPTIINAALQPSQFADERATSLEDQVAQVLRSPAEMGSSAQHAAQLLDASPDYRAQFARAFGVAPRGSVTPLRLRQAIGAYVRSLVALDSRFDRAVRGDRTALTSEERAGFTLFMGKAGCGTCHFAPLFNGNTPPLYRASDVEVIGTPPTPSQTTALDADSGRARIDRLPNHLRAFKTPSLRNIALTAPYMHNGAFQTLDEVIDFYNRGGAQGSGAKIDDQTLAPDSLRLSDRDRHALVAFLRTLTDTAGLRLPSIREP